jgi:hypothetical protein
VSVHTLIVISTSEGVPTQIYGNGDNKNQGEPFQVAQPYAFAGTTYTDGQSKYFLTDRVFPFIDMCSGPAGIAGLSLFKVLTNV